MLAEKLRKIAARGQYGHSRTPANFYMFEDYCSYHWSNCTRMVTFEEWQKLARLSHRYHRYLAWYKKNMFIKGEETYWMDNSISAVYTNILTGETETRMLKPPGGDICF